jgi:O-Antigen ligase
MKDIKILFKNKKINTDTILLSIFLIILALLPVHAIISTWAISNFGHADIFKSWKEILVYGMAFPLILWITYKKPQLILGIISKKINIAVLLFIGLNLIMFRVSHYGLRSESAGILFNTRFLAFLLFAQVIAGLCNKELVERAAYWLICIGGIIVTIFGFLQMTILPKDLLAHIGYSKYTILPYYTVSNNTYFIRIISTLRGPNELGAYMVFWFPILLILTMKYWNKEIKYRYAAIGMWIASVFTLYGSGSRSAIVASAISIAVTIFLLVNKNIKREMIIATLVIGIIGSVMLIAGRHTRFEQVTVFHQDPTVKTATTSNLQHVQSVKDAFNIIRKHPLGLGVGTTNVPSTYGSKGLTVENYFLDTMVETGIIGGLIFIAICSMLSYELWKNKDNDIAKALLAGLIGVSFVALLLPVWEDETLSMLLWGLAGIVISKRTI